jgi:nitrate reductase gamma subunit
MMHLLDTALQAGRSRVRFSMLSPEFFFGIILPAAVFALGLTQPPTVMSTTGVSMGVKAAGAYC